MKITDVQACVIGKPEPHSGGCVWTFVRGGPICVEAKNLSKGAGWLSLTNPV